MRSFERNGPALAAELLGTANRLWSSVECDVQRNCVVIYARLRTLPRLDLEHALSESERVLNTVLGKRLEDRKWLASVRWGDRLCRTFAPAAPALEPPRPSAAAPRAS